MDWIIIIIIILIVALVVWAVAGATASGMGYMPDRPNGPGPCGTCIGLRSWFKQLTPSQQALQLAWYNWKKAKCFAEHCKTSP